MSNQVHVQNFGLHFAIPLDQDRLEAHTNALQEILGPNVDLNNVMPIALRWHLDNSWGIARQPFTLWRRHRDNVNLQPLPASDVTVNSTTKRVRLQGSYSHVQFHADPTSTLNIRALDSNNRFIPNLRISGIINPTTILFRYPDIAKLWINGSGTVSQIMGMNAHDYANDGGWDELEIVGLPIEQGEIDPSKYLIQDQGRVNQLKSPFAAATERLDIGSILLEQPLADGLGGLPVPNWPTPTAADVLAELQNGNPSQLELIRILLERAGWPLDEARMDTLRHTVVTSGFQQSDNSQPPEEARVEIPLLASTQLGTVGDMWTALALGYGTTDFPPLDVAGNPQIVEPPGQNISPWDYMVTTTIQLGEGPSMDVAALAMPALGNPAVPLDFRAEQHTRNRALELDEPASEDVALSWQSPPTYKAPQSYVVGHIEAGSAVAILNDKRSAGSFVPYLPVIHANGGAEAEQRGIFIDQQRVVPANGTDSHDYVCAAHDVFGRWSPWVLSDPHLIDADQPDRPQLIDAKLIADEGASDVTQVGGTLQIEVAWDWQDRGPEQIEIVGAFYEADQDPPTVTLTAMQTTSDVAATESVVLTFPGSLGDLPDADEVPLFTPANVQVMPLPAQANDGSTRRYRVTVPDMQVDFTGRDAINYALFARASEKINASLFSDYTPAFAVEFHNPLPPAVPEVDEEIVWAALPDATRIARAAVGFDIPASSISAAGYALYVATEIAVRDAVGQVIPAGQSLQDRANSLKALATQPAASNAFLRVNRQLLDSATPEIELPGAAGGLYVCRLSAVSSSNVESARSEPRIVGVPQLISAGQPFLQATAATAQNPNGTVDVSIIVEPGAGVPPEEVALYRTRAAELARTVAYMGDPVADKDDARWVAISNGNGLPTAFTLTDTVTPSWFPYHYRAVAFGPDSANDGQLGGQSPASGIIDVPVPPDGIPDLTNLELTHNSGDNTIRVRFESGAEHRLSPMGQHQLIVRSVRYLDAATAGSADNLIRRSEHVNLDLPSIKEAGSPTVGTVVRKRSGATWQYETLIPGDADVAVIEIIDPLGRRSQTEAEVPQLITGPDLVDLTISVRSGFMLLTVRSAEPVAPPQQGAGYLLELFEASDDGKDRRISNPGEPTGPGVGQYPHGIIVVSQYLHEVGTQRVLGAFFRSAKPDAEGRYDYFYQQSASLPLPAMMVRLTDPNGRTTELRSGE